MWVDKRVKERNEKIKSEQNLLITLDPDVARVFSNSESFSGKCHIYNKHIYDFLIVYKGRSSNMMKATSKRRRTK